MLRRGCQAFSLQRTAKILDRTDVMLIPEILLLVVIKALSCIEKLEKRVDIRCFAALC
jgi:hypothetical protein